MGFDETLETIWQLSGISVVSSEIPHGPLTLRFADQMAGAKE
jgi:hypothetical protein